MAEQFQPTRHDQQQQYRLSLAMLLGALQTHQQSCMLWAHITDDLLTSLAPFLSSMRFLQSEGIENQHAQAQTAWQGELIVFEGCVTSSRIRELAQGQVVLEGHAALTVLSHSSTLTWTVHPHEHTSHVQNWQHEQRTVTETEPLETSAHSRWQLPTSPHLIKPLRKQEVDAFPLRQRQVLLLIYAAYDIASICRLLHTTPQHLSPILDALAEQGWIT